MLLILLIVKKRKLINVFIKKHISFQFPKFKKNFRKKKITKSNRFNFIYSKKIILVGIIDFSQTFILYEEHLRHLYEHDIVWNHFN